MDQELTDRLDTIIGLLNLAFAEPIGRARAAIAEDPVKSAIMEALGVGAMDAAPLQAAIQSATKQSERTITRRLSELVAQRIVQRIGSGPRTQYRLSGLIAAPARRGGTPTSAADG